MSETVSASHWQEFDFIPTAQRRCGLSLRCHAHGTLAKRLMHMAVAHKSGNTSEVSDFRETCVSRSLTFRLETKEACSRWTTLACHRLARVAACSRGGHFGFVQIPTLAVLATCARQEVSMQVCPMSSNCQSAVPLMDTKSTRSLG